jgi:hypothetical protein
MSKRQRETDADNELEGPDNKLIKPDQSEKVRTTSKSARADSGHNRGPLPALLDFSSLTTQAQITARFGDIADALLRDYHVVVYANDAIVDRYELLEVEFYLFMPGVHEDPFTHSSEEQKICGRWFVHSFFFFDISCLQ